ncbi:hypothetical protein JXM67_08470 [candidate division WOR-3 bacterium]|nr:hypothetical protein [candidate division WOR-3 bacterium]
MRQYKALSAVLLVAGFYLTSPAQTWTVEQVTDNSAPDLYPVATAVSSGLMVLYTHDDGDDELFFADNFMGPWTTNRITDNSDHDVGFDIAAQYSSQTAHISAVWEEIPDAEINYCTGNPDSWNLERVTDDADSDEWPSLAIDKAGNIHMAYAKAGSSGYEIFYANNATGSWVAEQVTDNSTRDASPWLALDSNDNPNIVFTGVSNLWFTKKISGIWTAPELVASGVTTASYPFLVMDADDNCHVTYSRKEGYYCIYYANNVTGSWQAAKVTTNDYDNENPTLYMDPNDKVHIVYQVHETVDDEIFYANNKAGIWISNRVTDNSTDDIVQFGRYFTVDSDRIGHVFFKNDSDGDDEIYHAYSNSPLFTAVEETIPEESPISIKLNSSLSATVNYSIPRVGYVSLKVYDAVGNLINTLVDGVRPEGEHTVTWNGVTDAGVRAAPGVYFYQLITASQTASVKGVLK